jgi:hypothetical protein
MFPNCTSGAGRNSHLLFRPATKWMLEVPVSIVTYNGLLAEILLSVAQNSIKEKRSPPAMDKTKFLQQNAICFNLMSPKIHDSAGETASSANTYAKIGAHEPGRDTTAAA